MPLPAYSICGSVPPSQNMAHGPGFPGAHDVYLTVENSHCVVNMKGSNIPSINVNTIETEETRRLRLD